MAIILQMKQSVILILTSLLTIQARMVMTRRGPTEQMTQEEMCSKLIKVNNVYCFQDEVIKVSGIPADISVQWKTGKVFFTLINEDMKMSLQVLDRSGEMETIKVAGLGQSTAVDNLNDIVYLATDNGVYKYKPHGSIELYTALGEDVMYVAVNSGGTVMYIATWPQNRVHKITNNGQKQETFSAIPNGHGLTLDTRNNIYFVASKTTYILKSGTTIPIKIKGLPSDKMSGIFVSRSDEVLAMDENSNMYIIDPENASATFVGSFNVKGVNTFGLDAADNVIIGVKEAIIRYVTLETSPCPQLLKIEIPEQRVNETITTQPTIKKWTVTTTESDVDDYRDDDDER